MLASSADQRRMPNAAGRLKSVAAGKSTRTLRIWSWRVSLKSFREALPRASFLSLRIIRSSNVNQTSSQNATLNENHRPALSCWVLQADDRLVGGVDEEVESRALDNADQGNGLTSLSSRPSIEA